MKKIYLLILTILTFGFGFGQSTLSAGDVVITGFNSDTPDEFTFVLLTDITNTTTIKFTDNGWAETPAPAAFRSNEGTITWTSNTDLPCGTIVSIINNSPTGSSSGITPSTGSVTTSGSFALSGSGDQILAYQGTDTSPNFIYAVNFNASNWSNATNSNTSALPPGLTNGSNAVALGNTDNSAYDCSVESNPSLILAAVSDNLNWTNSTSLLTLGGCTYSCGDCASVSTWNGSTWSSGTPDLTTEAILDADYDTNANGSFQACSLTLSSNIDLTISNNTFVEVEYDLTVETNAAIFVEPEGAFVQNDDLGNVNNFGSIEVQKATAPLNQPHEYTYWSSPVVGADINSGLANSNPYRRYMFLGENFLDATQETNNNNATNAGQDDIDDNGDDWVNVNGTTIMQPGIGYASMHDSAGFAGPSGGPYEFSYTFEGDFNNGEITVPVYRNDSQLNDINWNFVGNPYPSAIDADAFLAANSNLDGAIFLWSQNTAPASTTNGNEPLNFSNDDYSIINLSGQTAGGDGTTAIVLASGNRAIPSGQGFFVSFSNGATPLSTSGDIAQGEITFNNAMRVTDIKGNNEFFRTANSKNTSNTAVNNKLWVNLTSNNGIYNQILIAYLNGATNNDDGLAIDANKFPGEGVALYSIIEDSNKKFAIQGKPVESINEDEIINLGFNTYITAETLYTLSIEKLQGDFMSNNNVYLKDNLLNVSHNLAEGDYNFTSETGEFTDRFQIVFKEDTTLSVTDITSNENALQIIQQDNDHITFKTGTSETIKSVIIYDLYGRKLYDFKGQNSSETYRLSNINTAIFIAKIQLSNDAIITKKAIKR